MSVLALAPCAQPGVQWPRLMQAARPVVGGGGDGGVRRPPVPAQPVHRPGIVRAGPAQRDRRHRRVARRHARIAGEAGHAHHPVVLVVEALERPVVDRPVVRHAVERLHPEVRRVHARPVRRVDQRAAADAVEVGDLHRRVVVVHRIVGVAPAAVRADVEVGVAPRLPVAAVAGEVGGFHPVALLQAQDAHPGVGQAPGHRGARGAGADDQDIDFLVAGHVSASRPTSDGRRATKAGDGARHRAGTSLPVPACSPWGRARGPPVRAPAAPGRRGNRRPRPPARGKRPQRRRSWHSR